MPPVSDAFKIGKRLELGVGQDHLEWLPTRVEDYCADGRLIVAWPTDADRRFARVVEGETVQVMVAATQDALYVASASVEHTTQDGLPLITLCVNGQWQRLQRRSAVRQRVAVRPRIAEVLYGPAKRTLRLGITNVSASGLQIRSQDEIRRGDLLELAFELDGEVQLQARVRRVARNDRVWEAGCEFEGISETLAQRIVQFIFARQRDVLRVRRGEV
jgi:c-di-GMP-binding flagellar brake protein YcgR